MALNRVVNASRFLASSECPVCAPFNLVLVFVNAIRVANMFSRAPVPDILKCYVGMMMDGTRRGGILPPVTLIRIEPIIQVHSHHHHYYRIILRL